MKVAVFHNLPIGGAKRVVYQQVDALTKNGFLVDLYELSSTDESFLSLVPLVNKRYIYEYKQSSKKLIRDIQTFSSLKTLHKRIARDIDLGKYDLSLVHPDHLTQAPYLLRFLNTPTVYYCEELLRIGYERIFQFSENVIFYKSWYEHISRIMRKKIDRDNAQAAKYIFANSQFTKQNIFNAYNRKAFVMYPGINTSFYKPKKIKKEYDVLFIGEKKDYEGYNLFKEVVSSLSIRHYIRDRKRKNYEISDNEMVNLYNQSSIVICLNYNEPFGFIPLEAASCGVPVIAVNEGGFCETVVNNKTGFLVPRDNDAVSKAISLLLKDKKLYKEFSKSARLEVLKKWSEEKRMREFIQQLKKWQKK